jgi:hypothetical protein
MVFKASDGIRLPLILATRVTQRLIPNLDHLAVVHRIPSRLLSQVSKVEDEMEFAEEPDYSYFRSLIEYSFPQGGNGSVIYETPHNLNLSASSNTLSFTRRILPGGRDGGDRPGGHWSIRNQSTGYGQNNTQSPDFSLPGHQRRARRFFVHRLQ